MNNSELIHCDIAIIGAGAGGLSVAAVASQLGLRTVLIESEKMGGDCLNFGCVPSKSLLAAAKAAQHFRASGQYGIEPVDPKVNFAKVMAYVASVVETISVNDSVERFTKLGAEVILAKAEFVDATTIRAGNKLVSARRFVIATGSSPAVPPIPGLENIPFYTNETIFELRDQPQHLVIIGGGPIGCELAQAFCYLGVKVTLLEVATIMPKDEPDLVNIIRTSLRKNGVDLLEGVQVKEVRKNQEYIEIVIEQNGTERVISGSHLLLATGRKPNIATLNLTKANIAHSNKGIITNDQLRTTNKKVYAIGDVVGSYQFTHIANYHAGIVIKNAIFKLASKVDYSAIPWVTYTDPELAHVGLLASEAVNSYPDCQIIELPFADNDRAQTESHTTGKIKVIVTKKGKILGCSILGPNAGELILPWIMLIKNRKTLREISDITIPYPTLNEISKRVASEFYKPKLFSTLVKKIVNFLKYI